MIDRARLEQLFAGLEDSTVLVYGDLMLDCYLWGDVSRISPEAPVPVVDVDNETFRLGGAANVARNIRALGSKVVLVGPVGDDNNATKLQHMMERDGLRDHHLISDQKRPTTTKTRIIARNQQVVRADRESRLEIDGYFEDKFYSYIESRIDNIDCLLISDYGKGAITLKLLQRIIKLAREKGKYVSVDPKEAHFKNYRQASLITPNHHEASFAAGQRISDDKSLKAVGNHLLRELDLEALLITLGARGMALFERGDKFNHLPTVAKRVFDVTGAGDTVIAAMTAMVAAGADNLEAAYIANQAAGVVVEHIGTAVAERDMLFELLDSQSQE